MGQGKMSHTAKTPGDSAADQPALFSSGCLVEFNKAKYALAKLEKLTAC